MTILPEAVAYPLPKECPFCRECDEAKVTEFDVIERYKRWVDTENGKEGEAHQIEPQIFCRQCGEEIRKEDIK